MGEVDRDIKPTTLPPIIQVVLVDHWVYMFMLIRYADIGIRTDTLLTITMVDYTVSTQGPLNMIFLGVCEENLFKTVTKAVVYIHIKIMLIILIQSYHHTLI